MARIRTIKPEFPHSESLGRVSRDARLLFVMLWTICDDEGRARANSRMLASLLFPYDDDATQHIPEWLLELEREHCIKVYAVDGNAYVHVTNWTTHQKIDKPSKSRLPAAPSVAKPRERSRKAREVSPVSIEPSSEDLVPRTEDLGMEGTIVTKTPRSAAVAVDGHHSEAWFPQKAWEDFLEHRKKLRAAMTPRAIELALRELDHLRQQGHDPTAVIEQSIMRGWKGLFKLDQGNGNGRAGKSEWRDGIADFLAAAAPGEHATGAGNAGARNGAAGRGVPAEPRPEPNLIEVSGVLRSSEPFDGA